MANLQLSPKQKQQEKTEQLFKDCGVFWAFSNSQFAENKTPLKEGEKYVSIGGGGYLPKGNLSTLTEGMKQIDKDYKAEVKANKEIAEKEILSALNNYECFYTGDVQPAIDEFSGTFTAKQIWTVYKKHQAFQNFF